MDALNEESFCASDARVASRIDGVGVEISTPKVCASASKCGASVELVPSGSHFNFLAPSAARGVRRGKMGSGLLGEL